MLRARKNSTINFQECLGTLVRQCLCVSPSGMASQSSSSESQSLLISWRLLILGKMRTKSDPSAGVIFGSCYVGPSVVPRLFNALTKSSMEFATSVFRKMQFDKSVGAHTWELGAVPRSACILPFGIGLFLYGPGAHDWRNFVCPRGPCPLPCCIKSDVASWRRCAF